MLKSNMTQNSGLLSVFLGLANGTISYQIYQENTKNIIPRFARKKFLKTANKTIINE